MAPASTRNLARLLLAVEAASQGGSGTDGRETSRVCEKLRISLTRFAGPDGFTSLLRRSLALARADMPTLPALKVNPDDTLDGLEEVLAGHATPGGSEAAVTIIAHLLGLLVTFVGEPLTIRLVRDAWPDAAWDELEEKRGDS